MKTTIALKLGFHLDQWAKGLSVVLEKKPGVMITEKLRSILLVEADFNRSNMEIFGDRMMNNARIHGLVPEEIFSKKHKTSRDGTLALSQDDILGYCTASSCMRGPRLY